MYHLSESYKITSLVGKGLLLTGVTETRLVESATTLVLEALSEGPRNWEELTELNIPLGQLMKVLVDLEFQGILLKEKPPLPEGQNAFWEEVGLSGSRVFETLNTKSIQVHGDGPAAGFLSACNDSGIQITDSPALDVYVCNDYQAKELIAFNQKALRTGRPWILLKTTGARPLVGPIFRPGEEDSPCWECLNNRLMIHDRAGSFLRANSHPTAILERPFVHHPIAEQLASQMAVFEIIRFLVDWKSSKLISKIVDVLPGSVNKFHHVVKRPQCPVCGNTEEGRVRPKPIELKAVPILHSVRGGYRSVPASETLSRYSHHISPVSGVVPFLRPYRKISGAPVFNFSSGRNMALESRSLFWQKLHNRSANGGKGVNETQAKAGALCEAIERFCAMYHGAPYSVLGCFGEVDNAIDPAECLLFSDAQYQNRDKKNEENPHFYSLVPSPFSRNEVVSWTPVYCLTDKIIKYLPSLLCFAQYPVKDESKMIAYPDSNGCAAGNNLEEAILQGFLELVERDAAAIWWYNQISRPGVDIQAFNSQYLSKISTYYQKMGRSLYAIDITTDLGIPVFVAISHNQKPGHPDEILFAFGAHLDAGIALERAVVELNQMLPLVIKGNITGQVKDPTFRSWLLDEKLVDHKYLQPSSGIAGRTVNDYNNPQYLFLNEAIHDCLSAAEKAGLKVLVLDLTLPDIGLPVAKVICPGLRHFWRRTAPGRLYDVPVKLGWLDQAKVENELNPISIFI